MEAKIILVVMFVFGFLFLFTGLDFEYFADKPYDERYDEIIEGLATVPFLVVGAEGVVLALKTAFNIVNAPITWISGLYSKLSNWLIESFQKIFGMRWLNVRFNK